jgi:hypothetical protein
MRLTDARQDRRGCSYAEVHGRFGCWEAAALTQLEAAELLGVKADCSVWPSAQELSAGCVLR